MRRKVLKTPSGKNTLYWGQKRYHKETKIFAERSAELSGVICLKALVLLGNDPVSPLELFRKFFGAVRAIFWFCGSFLAKTPFSQPGINKLVGAHSRPLPTHPNP